MDCTFRRPKLVPWPPCTQPLRRTCEAGSTCQHVSPTSGLSVQSRASGWRLAGKNQWALGPLRASGGCLSFAGRAVADPTQPWPVVLASCWDQESGVCDPLPASGSTPDRCLTGLPLAALSALFSASVKRQPRWPLVGFLIPLLRDCCGALFSLLYRR